MGMVAIGMGIDDHANIIRADPGCIRHDVKHFAGQAGVEQCIDEQ